MQTLLREKKKKSRVVVVLVWLAAVVAVARGSSSSVEMKEVNSYDKQAYVGSQVEFECDLKNFYDSEIQWRKLIGRMSDDSEELSDGRLVIFGVTKEDAGEYECFNPENGDKRRMNLVVLQASTESSTSQPENEMMTDEASTPAQQPQQQQQQQGRHLKQIQSKYQADVDANAGGSVELYCEYKNEPDMRWAKVDGTLGPHKTIYGAPDNRLALHYLTEEDEGTYECMLSDGTTSTVYLRVLPAKKSGISDDEFKTNTDDYNNDYQLDNIQTVYAVANSNVKLVCEINDRAELNWRKIGGLIGYNGNMVDNRLELDAVTTDDSGIYECSSSFSSETMKFHVIVRNIEAKARPQQQQQADEQTTTTTTTTAAPAPAAPTTESIEIEESSDVPEDPVDSYVTRNIGAQLEIVCALRVDAHDTISWEKLDGPIDYSRATPYDNKLVFSSIQPNDAGIYQCKSYATRKAHRTRLTIMDETFPKDPNTTILQAGRTYYRVVTYETRGSSQSRNQQSSYEYSHQSSQSHDHQSERQALEYCREDEATCRNGQCIPRAHLCNGRRDCLDGSDEEYCGNSGTGYSGQCQPNEKPCRSDGKCIPKIWFCDGERECADGSDEENCSGPSPGGMCRSYEYMCKSNNQCVYKSFLCDAERDCADSSDEMGCIEPKVVQGPVRQLTVCLGATFQLECRATGFPVPFINWRLNWGHVCSEPRCCMYSDETGYGVLTVTDARWEDAGAYSCEAFSTKGREFAIPDAIVRIEQCNQPRPVVCNPNPCIPCRTPPPTTTTTTTTTTRRTTTPYEIQEGCECYGHSETCTCSDICYDCQHGTNGTHCEECLPGYRRDPNRPNDLRAWCYKDYIPPPFIRTTTTRPTTTTTKMRYMDEECPKQCNFHSIECTCDNKCHKCLHHTQGEYCEECMIGYRGNATHGTPDDCQPIPGFVCPGNTQGELDGCNECKPGYTGDPRTLECFPIGGLNTGHYHDRYQPQPQQQQQQQDHYDRYQPQPFVLATTTKAHEFNPDRFQPFLAATTRSQVFSSECNSFGTAQLIEGACKCKPGVVGAACDQCAPRFFHLVERKTYKKGCVSCFCNGLEVDCQSSDMSYSKLVAKFDGDDDTWKISDRFVESQHEVEVVSNGIEFSRFGEFNNVEMFFLVPAKFKGSKINSYGGRIEFNLTVRDQLGSPAELKQIEIRISGAHVNIVHKSDTIIEINRETPVSVQLVEDNFKRYGDNGRVDRDHLMMALSDIKMIMIRASYTPKQESIRLSDFTMDVAVENNNDDDQDEESSVPAKMVEVCQCPAGYTGNSCENCAEGYVRSRRGFYLGLCEPQQ